MRTMYRMCMICGKDISLGQFYLKPEQDLTPMELDRRSATCTQFVHLSCLQTKLTLTNGPEK